MTFQGIWILMNLRAKTGLIWSERPLRMMMRMKMKGAVEIADRRPEIKNIETENVANIRVAIEEVMVGVLRNPAQGIIRVQAKVIIKAATATEVALKVITTKIVTQINENMVQAVVLVNTITNLLKNLDAEFLNLIKLVFIFLVLKKIVNLFLTMPPT